jgi:hypothetical protein
MNCEDWKPPSYTDLRTAGFKGHPFHCADCGCDLNFKNPNFQYQGKGKERILLSASMTHDDPLCGHCLANRIRRWFKMPKKDFSSIYHRRDRKRGVCDSCHKNKIVSHIMWEDWCNVRFGVSSWNGHWICKDCLCECCEKGDAHSSHGTTINGKHYTMNEAGAWILDPE